MKPTKAAIAAASLIVVSLGPPANAGENNCSIRTAASVEVDVRANGELSVVIAQRRTILSSRWSVLQCMIAFTEGGDANR